MEDQQESREKRNRLRQLHEKFTKQKQHFLSTEDNQLPAFIQEVDELQKGVSKPREQAVDSELFKGITEAGLSWVGKLARGGKTFTAVDFIRRLKSHYVYDTNAQQLGASDPSAFDWAAVGRRVAPLFRPAPVVYHMLGPMDATPKERRQVVRQKRKAQVGEAVRPEELVDIGDSEKQETDKNMEEMWRVLKQQGGRVDLLQLVVNHQSFAQTVENLFTLSFLVRDKKVELLSSGDGTEVMMRAMQKGGGTTKKDEDKERVQFVVELDIDTWETFKEVVRPDSTLMPHRQEHHHALALEQIDHQQQQQEEAQRMLATDNGVGVEGRAESDDNDDDEEEEDGAEETAAVTGKRRLLNQQHRPAVAPNRRGAAATPSLKKHKKEKAVKVKREKATPVVAAVQQSDDVIDDGIIDLVDDSGDDSPQPQQTQQQKQHTGSAGGPSKRNRR